jgi:hypothetical protein
MVACDACDADLAIAAAARRHGKKRTLCGAHHELLSKTVFSFCEPKAAGHIQRRLL